MLNGLLKIALPVVLLVTGCASRPEVVVSPLYEVALADMVIRPNMSGIGSTDFEQKHQAIMEGERAALAALPLIRSLIQRGVVK